MINRENILFQGDKDEKSSIWATLVVGFSLMAQTYFLAKVRVEAPSRAERRNQVALSASNKEIEMKVKGGQYILPSDGKKFKIFSLGIGN